MSTSQYTNRLGIFRVAKIDSAGDHTVITLSTEGIEPSEKAHVFTTFATGKLDTLTKGNGNLSTGEVSDIIAREQGQTMTIHLTDILTRTKTKKVLDRLMDNMAKMAQNFDGDEIRLMAYAPGFNPMAVASECGPSDFWDR